jgi:hypothetical protein
MLFIDNNLKRKVGGYMKKFYFIAICLYIIFIIGSFNKNILQSREKNDLFAEILKGTKGEIVEYGLKTSFRTSSEGEKKCVDILGKLELDNHHEVNVTVLKNNNVYCIEFKTDEISGYIQYTKYSDYGTITIDILEHKSSLGLERLRDRVESAIDNEAEKVKYFEYVKARIESTDLVYTKDLIVSLLKENGAANIETVDLGRGTSTTAFTGHYEPMKNGNGWIDFNCALYSYESGNYVIIGTPIIMTSY